MLCADIVLQTVHFSTVVSLVPLDVNLLWSLQHKYCIHKPGHSKTYKRTCLQWRQQSSWASAQFLIFTGGWTFGCLATPRVCSKDWSECGDALADPSLHWIQMSLRKLCSFESAFKFLLIATVITNFSLKKTAWSYKQKYSTNKVLQKLAATNHNRVMYLH